MTGDAALFEALKRISTATVTTVLMEKGLRNVWMRGPKPLRAGTPRIAGRAFTLRFIPAREDVATPASWGSPKSTRVAIEAMPKGCIAVADTGGHTGAGAFGGAEETGTLLNEAARNGANEGIGLGEALGGALVKLKPKHQDVSLLCAAYEARVPFTAHVTIGGDISHFHPSADGAALGATSHTDFRLLAEIVRRMDGGVVYLNIGSAVTLPEVFLKCVTLVRNLGNTLDDITTANFDFIQSYRPLTNVVRRPTADGAGRGYAITGHHELTIPLLAAELICRSAAE